MYIKLRLLLCSSIIHTCTNADIPPPFICLTLTAPAGLKHRWIRIRTDRTNQNTNPLFLDERQVASPSNLFARHKYLFIGMIMFPAGRRLLLLFLFSLVWLSKANDVANSNSVVHDDTTTTDATAVGIDSAVSVSGQPSSKAVVSDDTAWLASWGLGAPDPSTGAALATEADGGDIGDIGNKSDKTPASLLERIGWLFQDRRPKGLIVTKEIVVKKETVVTEVTEVTEVVKVSKQKRAKSAKPRIKSGKISKRLGEPKEVTVTSTVTTTTEPEDVVADIVETGQPQSAIFRRLRGQKRKGMLKPKNKSKGKKSKGKMSKSSSTATTATPTTATPTTTTTTTTGTTTTTTTTTVSFKVIHVSLFIFSRACCVNGVNTTLAYVNQRIELCALCFFTCPCSNCMNPGIHLRSFSSFFSRPT